MKENTVVLSLRELDRLREIEKTHKIMLDGWVRYERVNNFYSKNFIETYKKDEIIEVIEKENKEKIELMEELMENLVKENNQKIKLMEELMENLKKEEMLKKEKKWFNIF